VMKGFATPLNGPLAKMHLGYDPCTDPYPYDVEKAKALLAEAGFPLGLKIVLDVPSILPDEAAAVAGEMKTQYALAGIDTEIQIFTDRPAYANRVRNKAIDDACAFDSSPLSTYQIFVDKFHSGLHGAWWQGYTNPEVDELIDLARRTVDYSQRKEVYRRAYRILHRDAPWIYLFNATLIWGVGSKAAGWEPSLDRLILLGPG
jgi:peptide/nickel transport system substrate-binding protein